MRLLVVEDEESIRKQLVDFLTQQGFAVDQAADGREGLYFAQEYDYDLAIIDIGLPFLDGIELIKKARGVGKQYPILILTARGNWQDKVEGLEAGADDYLVKPFHNEELRARVNALIRRASGHASPRLEFGPIVIDTAAKTVSRNGEIVELTSYEYNTLEYLAVHAGEAISKTVLTEHLYQQDFERDSNVIEVFIGRLRKKLDPDGSLQLITTMRGRGYRFNPDFQAMAKAQGN
ncbi:DNA-binding response regulator [Saccharophagus sp. K07]|jgi:two-component system response regulator PhoP|uniref:response regulator transcription factor n=1 Tax=Saccharophagus sp. K07 TaxID=2283636 RepID=UPI0016529228|nr:response regulator transcription factor [Saccharophagus sp. K07]MBC6904440.1 DNA-binding response regulator [Saccharophagus sp. K07]